jgi:hypothetical protein
MRRALLLLALLCALLALAAVWLFEWYREPKWVFNTDVYVGQIAAALGGVVVLATVVVGLVATAQRRHWGWLSGLFAAGLLSAVGSSIAVFVIHPWTHYGTFDPCPPSLHCEPLPPAWLPLPFLAAPLVVGLVVLLYRFQLRAPSAVR